MKLIFLSVSLSDSTNQLRLQGHTIILQFEISMKFHQNGVLQWSSPKPSLFHCKKWDQDRLMKFHGNISHSMYLKWFGILDKRVGKIFSYCWNIDISETRRKLTIFGITLLLFGLQKYVIYHLIENFKLYFLCQQKKFDISSCNHKKVELIIFFDFPY